MAAHSSILAWKTPWTWSLVGYHPWGHKELDTTERLHFTSLHFTSNENPGLVSFRIDWLDLLAVQGTLKSLLQHHSLKVSVLQHSSLLYSPTFSHLYMTTLQFVWISIHISSMFCDWLTCLLNLQSVGSCSISQATTPPPLLCCCLRNGVVYPEFCWLQLLFFFY